MYKEKALEIIQKHRFGKMSQKGAAVRLSVMDMLRKFCEQEEEFAQAIVQSDKNIDDCIEYTVKDCGSAISDLDVYKKAAEFYFPGAKVQLTFVIDLVGDAAAPPTPKNENSIPSLSKNENSQKSKLEFSFDDFFDV